MGTYRGLQQLLFAILLCKSCWSVPLSSTFGVYFEEIKPAPQLINPSLLGVVWRLVEAVNRHSEYQERVVRWLVRASKKKVGKDIVNALLWTPVVPTTESANASESSVSAASGTGGAEDSGKKSTLVLSLAGAGHCNNNSSTSICVCTCAE